MFKTIILSFIFCFLMIQGYAQEVQKQDSTQNGRYQMQVVQNKEGMDRAVYVLDTHTGNVWRYNLGGWEQFPPIPSTLPPFPETVKQQEGFLKPL